MTFRRSRAAKSKKQQASLLGLSLGALGVVFGDIGTSPLYAINEMFFGHAHVHPSEHTVLALISLVIWSLILVVAFKYVIWVLNADNDGEGGVFALLALLKRYKTKAVGILTVILVFAAGLLFGDGIITPAISVLSAIEGLRVATPAFDPYIIPITIAILTVLFAIQSRGTHKIGKLFGPVILVWFATIAILGAREAFSNPAIFEAFNPLHAVQAFTMFPLHKLLLILGSVMLVVTGGEALYADMGHFGKAPIRLSWFSVVMPCLMLNYLGQGAFLLESHEIVGNNIFYSMVPTAMIVPMVALACMATIIASQALISGAFSLTAQGIALGLLPRLHIKHTHEHHEGQIYIPFINWALYVGCVILVITFGSTPRLANAYGLAVSGVMVATTLSMFVIARKLWNWSLLASIGLFLPLVLIDSLFLTANSLKFLAGGFVPVALGLVLYVIMSTWRWGRHRWRDTIVKFSRMTMGEVLRQKQKQSSALDRSLLILTHERQAMNKKDPAPALLQYFVDRYHLLPRHVISLTVHQTRQPFVDEKDRYIVKEFENDHKKNSSLMSITAQFGFMEEPNVEKVIKHIADNDDLTPQDDMKDWIVYVGRERIIARKGKKHPHRMRAILYSLLVGNSTPTYEYYGLGEDKRLTAELIPVNIT